MTHVEPTIRSFMTSAPHTIGIEQTVATASRMMKQHDIRHLPVLHGGKIVGTTKGTPLNPPQIVERAFSVPVYLLDTTLGQ